MGLNSKNKDQLRKRNVEEEENLTGGEDLQTNATNGEEEATKHENRRTEQGQSTVGVDSFIKSAPFLPVHLPLQLLGSVLVDNWLHEEGKGRIGNENDNRDAQRQHMEHFSGGNTHEVDPAANVELNGALHHRSHYQVVLHFLSNFSIHFAHKLGFI